MFCMIGVLSRVPAGSAYYIDFVISMWIISVGDMGVHIVSIFCMILVMSHIVAVSDSSICIVIL